MPARNLGRVLPRQGQQVGDRAGGRGCVHDQHVGHRDHQRHRREVGGLVGQRLVQRVVDGVGADVAHQQGVAIGLGAHQFRGADIAARARLVLDHDGLAPRRPQVLGDGAREDVGGAAGRKRHDQGDRSRRPCLRGRRRAQRQRGGRRHACPAPCPGGRPPMS
ncbi:hypothetical protein G6F54_013487 [Rhizopus delemar]|nr:hypothetical protein G6F54_013487 [Rhizopus delemar]